MTERNGIALSETAAKHIAYFASAEWREIVAAMFSDAPTLEQCLTFVEWELRDALDSLSPMAPDNGRVVDDFHAGCCVLRAWATLTSTRFRKLLQASPMKEAASTEWNRNLGPSEATMAELARNTQGVVDQVVQDREVQKPTASRFLLSLETRVVVMSGVVMVDVSSLNAAAAWASFAEKLLQIGITVTEIPQSDTGWLRVELDALLRG